MIDKIYEDLYVKYLNFGQWTEEIIKEGLREAYELGEAKGAYTALKQVSEAFK